LVLSKLNFANLNAAPTGRRKAINAKGAIEKTIVSEKKFNLKSLTRTPLLINSWYTTIPGVKPLVITSARESSCKPKSLVTFNTLAIIPSNKSKVIPNKTVQKAASN
jgi:hypothetical protein